MKIPTEPAKTPYDQFRVVFGKKARIMSAKYYLAYHVCSFLVLAVLIYALHLELNSRLEGRGFDMAVHDTLINARESSSGAP